MELRTKSEEDHHQQMLNDVDIVSIQCDNGIENCHEKNLVDLQRATAGISSQTKLESPTVPTNQSENKASRSDKNVENINCPEGAQSQAALAFTIDFDDDDDNKKEFGSAKYKNLFQRYNARHRRNLSTSKLEIKTSKSSTELSPNFLQKQKPLSIHSEGYFSSEDDTKRKVDRLSQKLKELGLKTNMKSAPKQSDIMSRSLTDNKVVKRRSYCEEEKYSSKNSRPEMSYSATMNDLSRMQKSNSKLEEDHSNCVQYSPEKKYTKNIEYIEINHDYEDEKLEITIPDNMTEKLLNMNFLSDNCPSNSGSIRRREKNSQMMSVSLTTEQVSSLTSNKDVENGNLDVFNVSNIDDGSDGTVSEAGTYTIHKDYTDEEKARMDIDKEFSVGILTEKECNEPYVHQFKMRSSRDNNTWITEWATHVAEQTFLPPSVGGPTGRTPPLSPSKIPSPIYSRSQRQSKSRYEQSDSSLDADPHHQQINSNNLIDSGGESDEDTSNSYPTPPQSSQRTPTHTSLVRRGSLSEVLFKRVNINDCRRSMRKYPDIKNPDELNPSHTLARLHLDRSNSLDRKENYSDTAESNSPRRDKNYDDDDNNFKHTNSPIMSRLRSTTPKLTNSPILGHKALTTKIFDSPNFDRPKQFSKLANSSHSKNIGYYTCTESSPYMLRKSNSTSNYHEVTSPVRKELTILQGSPMLHRNISIQRSSSNNSIRNAKTKISLSRRSSFNDNNNEMSRILKGKIAGSDSSSETGEIQNPSVPQLSSGIKLNRAFSMRRARLNCDSDTTPNTTPEERRRKAQMEIKSAPNSARQQNHHRGRTSSVGASNKETFKKPETPRDRPRGPSLSRNDTGRYSMRAPKTSTGNNGRSNQKSNRDTKNSGRSNSTLTSKEVEFQNWKRRKNYDPMKAAAEGKKKGIDGPRKHHSIEDGSGSRDNSVLRSASFHGTGANLSLADDWSDNENNFFDSREMLQVPPPSSPLNGSDSDLDTSSYLQATHNVMSAMTARMTAYRPTAPVDSGGESDDDTSQSFRQTNKIHHEVSDTESSDEAVQSSTNITKFNNRSFEMRKARESVGVKCAPIKSKILHVNARAKSETPSIARTDSGRFSMRNSKGANSTKGKPKEVKKQIGVISKEQEMQNWKRRKSYDPMKAAMEGKRKAGLAKKCLTPDSSSVLRSQSFHGPVTFGISEWSDEDISVSADEAPIY